MRLNLSEKLTQKMTTVFVGFTHAQGVLVSEKGNVGSVDIGGGIIRTGNIVGRKIS